jgi:hypothetical protein
MLATSVANAQPTEEEVDEAIAALHVAKNQKFLMWNECGKILRGEDVATRIGEYATTIQQSIQSVETQTGLEVPYKDVVAITFRESSHDACNIGKQEVGRLTKSLGHAPDEGDIITYVKGWYRSRDDASKQCKGKKEEEGKTCRTTYLEKNYPQYNGISGWDLGAAQYRFPSANLKGRVVTTPSGQEVKVGLSALLKLDVSIQLLVEDLADFYKECQGHQHFVYSRWGKKRLLPVADAYYVHHHVGRNAWSLDYWKRMQAHFRVINAMKDQVERISSVLQLGLFNRAAKAS